MKRTTQIATLALAVLGAGTVLASDIYRYTDADGNVHYVDRPTGEPNEVRLGIASKPTNPAEVHARAQTHYGNDSTPTDGDDPTLAADKKPTRAERAAAANERATKCQQYRDQLETYVTSRRLYRETSGGEREYLDEKEVQEARTKTEDLVREYCD